MQNEDKLQEPSTLYDRVITELFGRIFRSEETILAFSKDDLAQVCRDLNIIKDNIHDNPYQYRTWRSDLTISKLKTGKWVIEGSGKGHYNFMRLDRSPFIHIPPDLFITDIPEATPDVVLKYGGGMNKPCLHASVTTG